MLENFKKNGAKEFLEAAEKDIEQIIVEDAGKYKIVSMKEFASGGVSGTSILAFIYTNRITKKIRNRVHYYRRYRNIGMRMKKTRRGRRK